MFGHLKRLYTSDRLDLYDNPLRTEESFPCSRLIKAIISRARLRLYQYRYMSIKKSEFGKAVVAIKFVCLYTDGN